MRSLLTIIIPTHNRPALISRAMDYYRTWGCAIIVCDSSQKPIESSYPSSIQIIHTPDFSLDRKLASAVRQVATPYVCISADDDFLSLHGVTAGIRFLDAHEDYVSIQGHYILFEWVGREIVIRPMYHDRIGFHIDDADPADRIVRSLNPYMHHIYSVHRSDVLKESLAITLNRNLPPMAEFSTALGGMIFGKHKMLPVFWMARDCGTYTSYNYSYQDQNTILLNPFNFIATSDGLSYRENFAATYALHSGDSVARGRRAFDQSFEAYKRFCSGEAVEPSLRIFRLIAKKWLPKIVLNWRRLLLARISQYRVARFAGYPFNDRLSKFEWQTMKTIILKHGRISQVEDRRLA